MVIKIDREKYRKRAGGGWEGEIKRGEHFLRTTDLQGGGPRRGDHDVIY